MLNFISIIVTVLTFKSIFLCKEESWELDCKESWVPKNWYFWTMVLEKTLESPLDFKEIKPVNLKGNRSWIFIGRTDAEAETPILGPPDTKNWLLGKDPDAGKDWRQEEKGMTEDEMVGWDHRLNEHEFEQALVVSDGQGSLGYCSPWGCKSDMTERLNWTGLNQNKKEVSLGYNAFLGLNLDFHIWLVFPNLLKVDNDKVSHDTSSYRLNMLWWV